MALVNGREAMKSDVRSTAKTRVARVSLSRTVIMVCMTVLAFALAMALAGCGETPPAASSPAETSAPETDKPGEAEAEASASMAADHEHDAMSHEAMEGMDAMEEAEGALEDASAETLQTTCPVMGAPINKAYYSDYNGRRIYFCCAACVEAFQKDPEKYIKKVDEEIAAKAG